ncbi:Bud site selection protein 20 [Tulasnella sp. 427]|nr:Bud site selection protein 20 [Tulasnella sp. 427]
MHAVGLFSRSSKSKSPSSRAAQFPYDPSIDRSRQPQPQPNLAVPSSSSNNPFDEPPPVYSPSDASKAGGFKLQEPVIESDLDVLQHYDTIFIIDDSGSMLQDDSDSNTTPKGKSRQTHRTRWEKARDALEAVVAMATQHDGNGVDIYFLNSEESAENCQDERDVMDLFRRVTPRGKTPTGSVLKKLITPYIASITPWPEKADVKSLPKPRNYIVITDGRPTDTDGTRLKNVIAEFAQRLDEGGVPLTQLGIQFLQVGDADDASEALKELDGDLKGLIKNGKIRDIVDTIPFEQLNGDISENHIIKVLVGSINKRVDKTHHFDMKVANLRSQLAHHPAFRPHSELPVNMTRQRRKRTHHARNHIYRATRTRQPKTYHVPWMQARQKDLDQIQLHDLDPKNRLALESQPLDVDKPGLAQHYCVECARYFETDVALKSHWRTKVHKRRVKALQEPAYTIEEAERAGGLGRETRKTKAQEVEMHAAE